MIRPAALPGEAAAQLAAALPHSLASADARKRVAALAALLPDGSLGQILELRLDGRGRTVDVSQSWVPEGLGALSLAAERDPRLSGVAACLAWAASKGHPRSLWLEWDLAEGQIPGAARPCLFLSAPAEPIPTPVSFFAEALHLLGAGATALALEQVLTRLPAGTRLRQLGVMLSRSEPVVRLVMDTRTPAAAVAAVAALCPQNGQALSRLLDLPGFAQASRLDLDLTMTGIGSRISLAARGVIAPDAATALAALVDWRSLGTAGSFGLSHLKASVTTALDGKASAAEVKAYVGLIALPALVSA